MEESIVAKKQKMRGVCRICGNEELLTEEHIIPRAAGGGSKIKLYSGDELLKTLNKNNEEKPYGKIKQNGHAEYTLCRSCNNHSGSAYDNDFAEFYNVFTQQLAPKISVPKGKSLEDFLDGKRIEVELRGIKPLNIAKRILVSFCSIEHKGLTDRKPEIRKAIIDKYYRPDVQDFSLYLSLHVGNSAYFGTLAALINVNDRFVTQAYAGIETEMLAFYLSGHDEHLNGGSLIKCLDVTQWLTKYKYDEVANVNLELMFNKSLCLRFPIPKWE